MGNNRKPLKDKLKVQKGRADFNDIRAYAKRYVGSPGFNQRLKAKMKELNDLSIFSPWSYEIDPSYLDNTILNLWEGLGLSWANPTGNSISMTEDGLWRHTLAHELGHLVDNGVIKVYKRSPKVLNVFNKDRFLYSTLYPELRKTKLGKEVIDAGIRPDSAMVRDNYNKVYQKYKNTYHDGFEEEPYADFFQMRYELDKLGLYDSTKANNKFTKEVLNKFREATNSGQGINGGYPYTMAIKRIFDNFTDDQIIEIMNTVAEADPSKLLKDQLSPDPSQAYYAKRGTRLIKKPKRK